MQNHLKQAFSLLVIVHSVAVYGVEKQRLKGHVHPAWARLEAIDQLPGTNEMTLALGLPGETINSAFA